MLPSFELCLFIIVTLCCAWWWKVHGQRDFVLKVVEQHCQKLNLNLLDGYVALKSIRFKRSTQGYLGFARTYSFEFTVTGEKRYTGYITLFGYHVDGIEIPPYPIESTSTPTDHIIDNSQIPNKPLYLEKYKRYDKEL